MKKFLAVLVAATTILALAGCGAKKPTEWLPSIVIKIAHILPSYWYINTNDIVVNGITSRVFINISILFMFGILFIILTNLVTYKKRKI